MKRAKKVMAVLLMAVLVIGSMAGFTDMRVSAASYAGNLTISCSSTQVSLNDEITVTVTLALGTGEKYSEMDISLDYNPAYLEYIGSKKEITYDGSLTTSSSGTSARVKLSLPADTKSTNYITSGGKAFTATFKVIKLDTSAISLQAAATHNVRTIDSGTSTNINAPAPDTADIYCAHKSTNRRTEVVKEPTCTDWGEVKDICTDCGSVRSTTAPLPTGHSKTEKITKEATCTQKGEKQTVCSKCNKVFSTEEIAATGHSYGEWTVVTAATADAEGLEERKCIAGDDTQSRSIAKLENPNEKATTQQQATEAEEQATTQSTELQATEAAEQTTTQAATQATEQQTTESTTQSAEQQTTETSTQSTEQQNTENTVTEAPATTEKAAQAAENKTTEGTANGVNTGDAAPVVLLSIVCAMAFAGVLLTAGRKHK